MNSTLAEILEGKGRGLFVIGADASVFEAVQEMVARNVGSLLVTDTDSDEIVGIVTERDYLRRVALDGRTDRATAVRAIMSSPLVTVTPETTIEEGMALMTERRIRHLPVVAHGEFVGLVSIGDLVKFTSQRQSSEIEQLTHYITGV
jgi:CBS domain-containing protein